MATAARAERSVSGMVLAAALCFALEAVATSFRVEHAETHLQEGVYLLNARIGFHFSEWSLDALRNGVPLTVVVDMLIVEDRGVLWDKSVAKIVSRQRLQSHALSGQYVVKNLNSGAVKTFPTLESATSALGQLKRFPLLDGHLLNGDKSYQLKLRAHLDIEALPVPMRPKAYWKSLVDSDDPWTIWPLEP